MKLLTLCSHDSPPEASLKLLNTSILCYFTIRFKY